MRERGGSVPVDVLIRIDQRVVAALRCVVATALVLVLAACGSAVPAPVIATPTVTATSTVTATPRQTASPVPTLPTLPTATAPATPPAAFHIGGTITWNAVITSGAGVNPTVVTVSGETRLVLLAEPHYGFTAERGGGSTYAYDYTLSGCSPTAHPKGTLETSVQGAPDGSTIANALIQGAPGQDMSISLQFNDQWEATCDGFTSMVRTSEQFPGCGPPDGWVTATFDNVDSYVIDCETSTNLAGLTRTGHVSGSLHPIAGR